MTSTELLLFGSWELYHYMKGVFAKRPTTSVEYLYNAYMHRLLCVILAQFFQTGSGHTRNTAQTCLLLQTDSPLQGKWPHPPIQFTHANSSLKNCLFLFNSVHKCFKSFSEMNSLMLPAAQMTLGLYIIIGFKKKNQPTTKRLCQKPGARLTENS